MLPRFEMAILLLAVVTLGGCAFVHQREAQQIEPRLRAAGFRKMRADTPDRSARLDAMRPYALTRTLHDGKTYWYYADPKCRCAYVGDDVAYRSFREELARSGGPNDTWLDSPENMEATGDAFSGENPELYDAPSNW
jgi:hypothetical protein